MFLLVKQGLAYFVPIIPVFSILSIFVCLYRVQQCFGIICSQVEREITAQGMLLAQYLLAISGVSDLRSSSLELLFLYSTLYVLLF